MAMKDIYKKISYLMPESIRKALEREISYSGIALDSKEFIGFLLFFSITVGILITLTLSIFVEFPVLFAGIAFIAMLFFINYTLVFLIAENRARFVEKVLPDALQLIATNIKVGLTTERALTESARPEFGVLAEAFNNASKKILSGISTTDALLEMGKEIKSKRFERTLQLISEGVSSGGELADLLLQLSNDLKTEASIEEEVRSNIAIYTLMIIFVATVAGPILLGVATIIVEIIVKNIGAMPAIKPTGIYTIVTARSAVEELAYEVIKPISAEFVLGISIMLTIVNAVFSSLVLGIINAGSEKKGAKYIPIIIVIGVIAFFVSRFALQRVFEGFII